MLLSLDVNRLNDLFLQIDNQKIISKYEKFKTAVNLHLLEGYMLEDYIKTTLLANLNKGTIRLFLQNRHDYM